MGNHSIEIASTLGDTRFCVFFRTPAVHLTISMYGKGMIRAGGYVHNLSWQPKLTRLKTVMFSARKHPSTKFIAFACAPGENCSIEAERENVIAICCNLGNLLREVQKDWQLLYGSFGCNSYDTFLSLAYVLARSDSSCMENTL